MIQAGKLRYFVQTLDGPMNILATSLDEIEQPQGDELLPWLLGRMKGEL